MPRNLCHAVCFLLGFWFALSCVGPLGVRPASADGDELGLLAADLYAAVNATRGEHHRGALRRLPELDRAALDHSRDMAARGYMSHETPEGTNPVDRIRAAGLQDFMLAGENVGLTSRADPAREILVGWLTSPVHRANLLAPAFNATGVGVARAADGTLYFTQLYANVPR